MYFSGQISTAVAWLAFRKCFFFSNPELVSVVVAEVFLDFPHSQEASTRMIP
jgi:hypothetical protein